MRFNGHGKWEMLIGAVVFVAGSVLFYAHWWWWVPATPVIAWLFAFFRDPNRPIPAEPNVMVSPADGTVSDITDIDHDDRLNGPAVRIGIFLSVFNVHVNRSPCDGKISAIEYKEGKFLNAMNHSGASNDNESNTLTVVNPATQKPVAVVKQIVGLIARRIICDAGVGDTLQRGQRFGLIKFGSRTELTIPKWLEPKVTVRIGQKVAGAKDVIARLGKDLSA